MGVSGGGGELPVVLPDVPPEGETRTNEGAGVAQVVLFKSNAVVNEVSTTWAGATTRQLPPAPTVRYYKQVGEVWERVTAESIGATITEEKELGIGSGNFLLVIHFADLTKAPLKKGEVLAIEVVG